MTGPDEHEELLNAAWAARENARILGKTKVGAAVLSDAGNIYSGCNVEHRFRSHDVHAEVNALTSMVTAGDKIAELVAVASIRENFTPCGACMDWIFELGGPGCRVLVLGDLGVRAEHAAADLMPHYPF